MKLKQMGELDSMYTIKRANLMARAFYERAGELKLTDTELLVSVAAILLTFESAAGYSSEQIQMQLAVLRPQLKYAEDN